MKHEIILPIALLKAASLCAAEEDFIRPMLENVAINDGHIVATNGHIMFYSPLDGIEPNLKIQIPNIHVKSFLEKIENFSSYINCKLVFDTELNEGFLELPNGYCAYEGFRNILKIPYINWKSVIPEFKETTISNLAMPVFNPQYIQKMIDIAQILGNIAYHKLTPLGEKSSATVSFYRTDYDQAKALIMPMLTNSDQILYCVEIGYEGDSELKQYPAESADIALEAVKRMRKELNFSMKSNDPFYQNGSWIRPAVWTGSPHEHSEKMFYTKEWFKKPLKKFDNLDDAKAYMIATADCVECYNSNGSLYAHTLDEVDAFFKEPTHG